MKALVVLYNSGKLRNAFRDSQNKLWHRNSLFPLLLIV